MHELDRNTTTGKAAMFSVKESPWHKEGQVLTSAPSFDEAMILAGVDFQVEKRPIFVAGADGQYTQSPTGHAIVRTDRAQSIGQAVVSIVGDDYVPLQNRDAFGVLEPLLDRGVATLETGGSLREGRDVWMMVRFATDDPVVQEVFTDEVIPFGLITNNHSGAAKARIKNTPIRVVCANTLAMAFRDGWSDIGVAHRGDAKVRMVEAAERLFAGIVDRYRVIAEQYRAMKVRRLETGEFQAAVLDIAAPLPKKLHTPDGQHLTTRGYDAAYEAAWERQKAITRAWTHGKGHVGDFSAWEAYNGAVEVIDHDAQLFKTRGSRVSSLIGGRLLELKAAVLNRVAGLCEIARN